MGVMHLPPVRKLGFCEVVAPSPDYARRRREMLLLVLSALRQVMGAGHVLRELRQPGPEEALPVSTRPTSSAVGWDSVSRSRPRAQLLGFARGKTSARQDTCAHAQTRPGGTGRRLRGNFQDSRAGIQARVRMRRHAS